ncbi:hypothetical protein BSK66_27785 [Paenibacillus odorifer]|uniref:hypothetical protein n=1 Tax=Paenibacillus TaxID=44249 RepID=UPI0003E28F58|nr:MULTISPECIES: hypothetical protein [Paenibacillus]ETT53411.1 hypothetical protein C171_21279 [Paenibacillus sp. FSL H8-237]OMD13759.1 hypothetical protein BJP47_24335 [Paenibacillus odorifer]OME48989.1 hypothetical protein BSK66_27785 [Paenibacillus odorifer]
MSTTRRSPEERLADVDKKMEQLKARQKDLRASISQENRKQRTKRLIEVGAIFETNFGIESKEEAELIASKFRDQVQTFLKEKRNS